MQNIYVCMKCANKSVYQIYLTSASKGIGCPHEVESAVWWDEGDRSVIFEASKAHALMKLHVLQIHCFSLAATALCLEEHLRGAPVSQ